jgi:hypothetical protein
MSAGDVNSINITVEQETPAHITVLAENTVSLTVGAPTLKQITAGQVTGSVSPVGSAGGALQGNYPAPTLKPTGVVAGEYLRPSRLVVLADGRLAAAQAGDGGASAALVLYQPTPSAHWQLAHNLNNQYPSFTVIDSAGDEVEGDPDFVNPNRLDLLFGGAFSGKVIFHL